MSATKQLDATDAATIAAVASPAWAAPLSSARDYVATIQYLQSKAPAKKRYFYAEDDELGLRPWSEDILTCVELLKTSLATVSAEEDSIVVSQLKPFIIRAAENISTVAKKVYRTLKRGDSPHCANDMVTHGARLVAQMYTRNDPCLSELGKLLSDTTTTYYAGTYDIYRRKWLNSNTLTGLRIHAYLVERYEHIVNTLCADEWVGAATANQLLATLNLLGPLADGGKQQQPEGVDREQAHEAALRFMARLQQCVAGDLQMKFKRNEKSLKPVYSQLERLAGSPPERHDDVVPWFWLEHVDLKFLNSENLQERLFAAGEFAWFARQRASNLDFEHRALREDTFVAWLNEHHVFECLFDPKLMHPEVLRRGKPLCGWLALRERYGVEGAFTLSRLKFLWERAVSGTPENATAIIEVVAHCASCLPKDYLPAFFQSDDVIAALQNRPAGSRSRLVDLLARFSDDTTATPAVTTKTTIGPTLSLLWGLIWHPCYAHTPPNALTTLFKKIMRYQGAEPFRDQYVHTCLEYISAKKHLSAGAKVDFSSTAGAGDNDTENYDAARDPSSDDDAPRQLAFRLLQIVVRTMDIEETEKVIDQIEKECDDFLQMLIDELCQFTRNTSGAAAKDSFADGVLDRLTFLSLVLKQSRLHLTAGNVRSLYESSTQSVFAWGDKLWRWLKRLVTDGNCLQMAECRATFLLICTLDPSTMSKSLWFCWETMFVHCNGNHLVTLDTGIIRAETSALLGFEYLWRIATEAGESASSFAVSMSRKLYLQVLKVLAEPGDALLTVQGQKERVLNMIGDVLESCRGESYIDPEKAALVARSLTLLRKSMCMCRGGDKIPAHGNRGRGHLTRLHIVVRGVEMNEFEVNVDNTPLSSSSSSSSSSESEINNISSKSKSSSIGNRNHKSNLPSTKEIARENRKTKNRNKKNRSTFQITLHNKMTLAKARDTIQATINPGGQGTLMLFQDLSQSRPLKGDNKTLAELGINDADTIVASKSPIRFSSDTEDDEDAKDAEATAPWDDMVRDERFSLIYALFSKIERRGTSNELWNFLQSVPTDMQLLRQLQSPYVLHKAPWEEWFGVTSKIGDHGSRDASTYTRAVYIMQILDSMLMPTDRSSASDTGARTWRKNFLQSSGFNCIIDFLMQHMGGEVDVISRTGLSLAIRLSQFFLLGMLSSKGITVTDDRQSPLPDDTELFLELKQTSDSSDQSGDENDSKSPSHNTSMDFDHDNGSGETKNGDKGRQTMPKGLPSETGPISPPTQKNTRPPNAPNMSPMVSLPRNTKPAMLRSFSVDSADLVSTALESGALLEKLITIIFREQFTPNSCDRTEMMVTALVLVEGILRLKKDHICNALNISPPDMKTNDGIISATSKTGLMAVLLREPAPRVRKIMIMLFQFMAESSPEIFTMTVHMLSSTLNHLDLLNTTVASSCQDFFELTEYVFAQIDTADLPTLAQPIIDKIHELAKQHMYLEPFTGARELTNPLKNPEQNVLARFLRTLGGVLQRCPRLAKDLGEKDNPFIVDMIDHYLFKIGTFEDPTGAICFTPGSREAAFDVLRAVAVASRQNLARVLSGVRAFSESISPKTDRDFNPELYKKSSAGYAGIQNQGNTCYMNATLQQIFMITSLRRGILSFPTPPASEENEKMNCMRQLQRALAYLSDGSFCGYNARALVKACATLGLSDDVFRQNCAAEFVTKIVERVEELTQGTSHQTLLKWHFGGSFAHQTIRFGDNIPPEHRSSSREEPFVTLGLDIAGRNSIVESLDSWAEGERMEGQNQLNCDFLPKIGGKTQKVDGLRRTCISKLPNTLIIHLKRFGIDYTTFTPYKINTYCEFPDILDMHKYTAEYLEKTGAESAVTKVRTKKSEDEDEDEDDAREGESQSELLNAENCTYKLSGVVVHQGAAGGGHYWSLARSDAGKWVKFNDITVTSFPEANFAEETYGGSYERATRNQLGKTTTVQVERIKNAYILYYERVVPVVPDVSGDNSCLGTSASAEVKNSPEESEGEFKEMTDDSGKACADSTSTTPGAWDKTGTSKMLERIMRGLRVASDTTVGDNKKLHGLREWAPEVWKENSKVQRKRYLYNTKFFEFVSKLAITSVARGVIDIPEGYDGEAGASAEQSSLRADLAMYAYSILHQVVMCSKEKGNINTWVNAMKSLLRGQSSLCARIVAKTADDSLTMRRFLIGGERDVRKVYGSILSFAVTQLSERACQECKEVSSALSGGNSDGFVDIGSRDDVGSSKTTGSPSIVTVGQTSAEDILTKFGTGVLPALLSSLVKIQANVIHSWSKSESFLRLYADMARGPTRVQQIMIQQNALAAMCHLYLGRDSTVANMPELPLWGSLNKYTTMDVPDLCPIVRIINHLIGLCSNGLDDLPNPSLRALHQTAFIKKFIWNSPALMTTLIPLLSRDNERVTVCSIEAALMASGRATTSAEELVELLVTMLSIEDRYAPVRLKFLFNGMDVGGKQVKGLIQRAKSKTRAIQNPRAAKSAYKLIKIISLLDTKFPPAKDWLVRNKKAWVSLVDWLHTESYEASLNGNRYKLLRRASAEETVLSLAVTGNVTLSKQEKVLLGGPVLDRNGNAQFGWWRGIRTASNLSHGGYTDTARAIFKSPCPEDGSIREVRLLMGGNRKGIHDDKSVVQDDEYYVEVFQPVDNDMERNVASGLDMTQRLISEIPAGTKFRIGDKVECAAPLQGASDPMCGFVTNITQNAEGVILYDLAYEDARNESDVPEFLCAKADKDKVTKQNRYAFQLVSTTPIPGVHLLSNKCQCFVVDIAVIAGQYIGIRSKSGELNLYHSKVANTYGTGGLNSGADGLIFTRTQTGTEAVVGHIDYNMKPDSKAKWGFSATVRYNSVVSANGPGDFGAASKVSLADHVSLDDMKTYSSKVGSSDDDDYLLDDWADEGHETSYVARYNDNDDGYDLENDLD